MAVLQLGQQSGYIIEDMKNTVQNLKQSNGCVSNVFANVFLRWAITFSLILISSLFLRTEAIAQENKESTVRIGKIDPEKVITDIGTLNTDPHVTTRRKGCTVTSYSIAILYKGQIQGVMVRKDNAIATETIDLLKTLKGKVRIYIEDVTFDCDTKNAPETGVVYHLEL